MQSTRENNQTLSCQETRTIPNTFSNLMLYGNRYFGGIGLLQLFAEQGMNQTLSLMRHIRAKTSLGNQILIAIRHYQTQAGISKCVLTVTRQLPYLDIPWFDTLRQYLDNINGRIELTDSWRPTSQRQHDSFLNLKTFTPQELKIINACHLYYQVARVSDITTSDGSRLLANIYKGKLTKEHLNLVYHQFKNGQNKKDPIKPHGICGKRRLD